MEFGLTAAWLVSVVALWLLALPVAAWVFPRGDHGAYAITLALVVLGAVGHLVGHVAYRTPALVAGVLVLVVLATVTVSRVEVDWRGFAVALGLFAAAFALMVALRAASPSAGTNPHWLGEMFLDYGLLASLERADTLPPPDMWFAGETVRYHYGGQLLTSLVAGLTGTSPAYAYNLGLATFYAALVTMAWGVAGSIARPMAVPTRWAAGLGAFFVAVAANLETALYTLVWLLPRQVAGRLVDAVGVDRTALEWTPGDFHYWDTSRVITRGDTTPATEFPLFSWLHADLHAHVLVKPLLLLVVAVGVAYWYTPATDRRRRLALVLGVLPPIFGLVAVTNMWSVPVVAGLVAVVLVFAPGHPLDLVAPGRADALDAWVADRRSQSSDVTRLVVTDAGRVVAAVGVAAVVTALSVAWSAPYWWYVVLGGPGESVTTWDAGTPLGPFLVVMGAFVVGFVVYIGARLGREGRRGRVAAGAAIAVVVAAAVVGWAVAGLVVALLALTWWYLRRDVDAARGPAWLGPETMLIVAGLGVVLIVEFARHGGMHGEFNTVFKAYADVWQLWAVALGVVAARIAHGWPVAGPDRDRSAWAAVGLVFVVLLVLSTGAYAAMAVPAYLDDGNAMTNATAEVRAEHGHTLDATAYLEVLYPEEAEAIRWLDERDGQPTIVTNVPAGYFWRPHVGDGAAAPASLTGVPTVLGWSHQWQYRGYAAYSERLDDVRDIYVGDPERQAELLEAYGVDYVYVGPSETYGTPTIDLERVDGVSVAVSFDEVTIYEVDLNG